MPQISSHVKYYTTEKVPTAYAGVLPQVTMAYETFGQLSQARNNAILLIHSFSYHSHAARHDANDTPGWWDWAIGPGRPFDTDKFFIVCANNFGGCYGSTGPLTLNPKDGKPFGRSFPLPTTADIVHCQRLLQQELGIGHWHAIVGGSLGGMAVLQWAASYPDSFDRAVCFHSGVKLSHIGQGLFGIQADIIRRNFQGLALAASLANVTSVTEEVFQQQAAADPQWRICDSLKRDAAGFVDQFDADSFLGFINVVQQFDLQPGDYPVATCASKPKLHLIGSVGDLLFPPSIIEETKSRFARYADVRERIIHSRYGHDGFLLDEPLYRSMLADLLA